MTEDQLKRLPAYAQEAFRRLQNENNSLKSERKELLDIRANEWGTRVTRVAGMESIPMKEGVYRFQLTPERCDYIDVNIERDKDGNSEYTKLVVRGGGSVIVEPKVSNVVLIRMARQKAGA